VSPALSACLIARDEADRLPACLDALGFADEVVVVVDARSRDASERIARERGARVERRPFAGDVAQKRDCVGLARHEWVLLVDPDEVVSPALAAELKDALTDPRGAAGFELDRVTWHLGRWLRHGDFHPDWKLRVFRRSRARFTGRDPHGRVVVDGPVRRLRGELWHYSYRDLADQVARIQLFSAEAARALQAEGRRARGSDLLLRPPARFLRAYVLKRGFLDGRPGLIVAALTAFHVFLKYAKLWERQRREIGAPGPASPGA
jgi:glycosyltransferase involved in cell wall biosynthesis